MRFNDALMCVDTGNALTMCRPKCLMKLRNGNLARQSLFWLGHLARMDARRLPKQAAFGLERSHDSRATHNATGTMVQTFVGANSGIPVGPVQGGTGSGCMGKGRSCRSFARALPHAIKIRRLNEFRLSDGSPGIHEVSYRRVIRKRENPAWSRDPTTGMYHCPLCPARFDIRQTVSSTTAKTSVR